MRDRELYQKTLGIEAPWAVVDVQLELEKQTVEVYLELSAHKAACPECAVACGKYDTKERRWRHLDTMQYQTLLVAQVPRVQCEVHGIKQVKVTWAEAGSRFTQPSWKPSSSTG